MIPIFIIPVCVFVVGAAGPVAVWRRGVFVQL
jgi:hypothetical protein